MSKLVKLLPKLVVAGLIFYIIAPWSIRAYLPTTEQPAPAVGPTFASFAFHETLGLEVLRKAGALRPPTAKELLAWNEGASLPYRTALQPKYRSRMTFDYIVTQAIQLPPGLHGGYSKRFLVAAGVPEPEGDPGHSCVATMDAFKVVAGSHCHDEESPAIRQLAEIKGQTSPAACQLLRPSERDAILAVGVYQAIGRQRAEHTAGPIAVNVTKPGDVVLVLSAYEPVQWKLTISPQTRVLAVVLTGYHASTVEGAPTSATVFNLEYGSKNARPQPLPECDELKSVSDTPSQEGPGLLLFDHHIRGILGRGLDSFLGAYELSSIDLR